MSVVEPQADARELAGPERVVGVVERRLQLDRVGRRIDDVVDERELAGDRLASRSCGVAVTGKRVAAPMCCLIVGGATAGTAKVTKTGSTCAIVMSSVVLAVTRLPAFTVRLPVRPAIGDRIDGVAELHLALSTAACCATICAFALSIAALSALTAPAGVGRARDCSPESFETMPRADELGAALGSRAADTRLGGVAGELRFGLRQQRLIAHQIGLGLSSAAW